MRRPCSKWQSARELEMTKKWNLYSPQGYLLASIPAFCPEEISANNIGGEFSIDYLRVNGKFSVRCNGSTICNATVFVDVRSGEWIFAHDNGWEYIDGCDPDYIDYVNGVYIHGGTEE
jgi:hypothetical protein